MHERAAWTFLTGVLARGLASRCARLFEAHRIPVMALKGVALHALVYDDPAERPLSDVDLLVAPRDHARAIAALEAVGFERQPPGTSWAATLTPPDVALAVDLHDRVFPPGLYRLDVEGLFARAKLDTSRFCAPVWLPDFYDLYAHCVGHFAKTRMDERNPRSFIDLERIAAAGRLDPRKCALHLEATGLGRAARYTLGAISRPDAFARGVLDALPGDTLGDLLAITARSVARACDQPSAFSAPAAHLVNRRLGQGLISLGAQAIEPLLRGGRRGRRP